MPDSAAQLGEIAAAGTPEGWAVIVGARMGVVPRTLRATSSHSLDGVL